MVFVLAYQHYNFFAAKILNIKLRLIYLSSIFVRHNPLQFPFIKGELKAAATHTDVGSAENNMGVKFSASIIAEALRGVPHPCGTPRRNFLLRLPRTYAFRWKSNRILDSARCTIFSHLLNKEIG
jgi:hypothetical protein